MVLHQRNLDLQVKMDLQDLQVKVDLLDLQVVMDLVVLAVVMVNLDLQDHLDPLVSRDGQHINGDE